MALKITLSSGDEHVVQFDQNSTLTVGNLIQLSPEEKYTDSKSWSQIAGVEIVPDPPPPVPEVVDAPPEAQTEAAPADVTPESAAASEPDPAAATSSEPPAGTTITQTGDTAPTGDVTVPGTGPDGAGAVNPDSPSLASPADALAHAAEFPTTADALTHIQAALLKFPDDPDLLVAQADLTPAA